MDYKKQKLLEDFVYLKDIDSSIIENSRYFGSENFLGRPVKGYASPSIICTKKAAEHLKKAHDEFKEKGYLLVVYDAYRPQRAVDEFKQWGENKNDNKKKSFYYPTTHDKKDLFINGFIAYKSDHSKGSTFDLTIIEINKQVNLTPLYSTYKLNNGEEIPFIDDNTVNMGSSFDLFHIASYHDSPVIHNKSHIENRNLLREVMQRNGFKEFEKEWWHYTLEDEPFKDIYFDFIVK